MDSLLSIWTNFISLWLQVFSKIKICGRAVKSQKTNADASGMLVARNGDR